MFCVRPVFFEFIIFVALPEIGGQTRSVNQATRQIGTDRRQQIVCRGQGMGERTHGQGSADWQRRRKAEKLYHRTVFAA
jgi:hypothetical protein